MIFKLIKVLCKKIEISNLKIDKSKETLRFEQNQQLRFGQAYRLLTDSFSNYWWKFKIVPHKIRNRSV